jgi:hypothetical protein
MVLAMAKPRPSALVRSSRCAESPILARVAVILHERLGNWARQLRPRLHGQPVRWFETRSRADLEAVLPGLAAPVVLIDLGRRPAAGLTDLDLVLHTASDARVLVLDPESHDEVAHLARELGATHTVSGFVPPPVVAALFGRWIALAQRRIESDGWSRNVSSDSGKNPWGWLAAHLGDLDPLDALRPPSDAQSDQSPMVDHRPPPPFATHS